MGIKVPVTFISRTILHVCGSRPILFGPRFTGYVCPQMPRKPIWKNKVNSRHNKVGIMQVQILLDVSDREVPVYDLVGWRCRYVFGVYIMCNSITKKSSGNRDIGSVNIKLTVKTRLHSEHRFKKLKTCSGPDRWEKDSAFKSWVHSSLCVHSMVHYSK